MSDARSIQRYVDDQLAGAPTLIDQARVAAIGLLSSASASRERASGSEQAQRQEACRALMEHGGRFNSRFVEALRKLVLADLDVQDRDKPGPASSVPTKAPSGGGLDMDHLALMDETVVESDLEISRATALIDSVVEWEQRELQAYTSALRGAAHVGNDSNPIRPAMVAKALWEASGALALEPPQRAHCQRSTAEAIAPLLKEAYAVAWRRLETNGVTPSRYRTVVLTPGAGIAARNAANNMPSALQQLSLNDNQPGTLLSVLTNLPAGGGSGHVLSAGALARAGAIGLDVEFALSRLDTMVRYAGSVPSSRNRMDGNYAGDEVLLTRHMVPGVDRRLIDLLSRLFQAILSDPALPAAAKGAIARLQVSTLRVALRDRELLESIEHPTWLLMDRIAGAFQVAAAGGPERLSAVALACDSLTDELARQVAPDAALYRQILNRLDALVAQDLNRAVQEAQGMIAKLERADRKLRIKAQVRERMQEQFADGAVGQAVSQFLLGPMASRLTESILEKGPEGGATMLLTRLVDELLWSLHPPATSASRRRLIKVRPYLLASVRKIMSGFGVSEDDQAKLIEELEVSHRATLSRDFAAANAAGAKFPATQGDVAPGGRKASGSGSARRRGLRDSVLDMANQDTVPIDMSGAGGGRDEARSEARRIASSAVAAMEIGRAVRLQLQGRWLAAQLLWRSESGEILLLADSSGRNHAMTRRALERMQQEGLTNFDPPISLIKRAVDAILSGSGLL
jgi:hypothetical protein